MIATCDLYCCLLPQCEALRTCRSGLPIATKHSVVFVLSRQINKQNVCEHNFLFARSSRLRPVSANSIAWQIVKEGTHKTGDRESTRLINKELSDLWKIPTLEGHSISEPFRLEELAAALRRLKPGKSPGLGSLFREVILHVGSAPKSCFFRLPQFLHVLPHGKSVS